MDELALRAGLDACLLDEKLAQADSTEWTGLPNPFPTLRLPGRRHDQGVVDRRWWYPWRSSSGSSHWRGRHRAKSSCDRGSRDKIVGSLAYLYRNDRHAHLRSPAVHHLDLDPWSLKQFASKKKHKNLGRFAPPYERPALALFNAHCDTVIEHYGLDELHIQARATGSHLDCDGVKVSLSTGETVTAHHLVLAIGGGEAPEWPSWVPKSDPRVSHVFSVDFDAWPTTSESILVVGGGISAGQVSLRLAQEGHQVHLVSRHPLRQHQFDSEPGWLGPRFMKGFSQVKDADQRRAVITDARHKGSVPPDVWRPTACIQ